MILRLKYKIHSQRLKGFKNKFYYKKINKIIENGD